jgi:O-antigen/teichoic acid export membrane protein
MPGLAEASGVPSPGAALPPMGKKVGAGMIVMVLAVLVNRGTALLAQAIVGLLLTRADFGIFAIATAAAGVAMIFRDGGLRFILLQRGVTEYASLSGPVFWMSLTLNMGSALLIGVAAPVVARVYHDPRLTVMLLLIAASVPAGTIRTHCDTRLRVDLRFRRIAVIGAWSAVIRYGVTIATAYAGVGPFSLVYGLLAATVFEAMTLYAAAPERPWSGGPRTALWPSLFQEGKWTMMQGLAVSTIYFGMYASMGLFVSKDTVGVYSWAFAILTQSGHLIASQFENVLLPSIARLQHDVTRRRIAVLRSLHAMAVSCLSLSLYLGIVYAPVEALIWRGKWVASVPCVWIMALTYPLFILHLLPRTVLMSGGEFRRTALLMLLMGAGMTISAGLSAWLGGTAVWITAGTGVYSAVAAAWMMRVGLCTEGIDMAEIASCVIPVAVVLSLAAAGLVALDQIVLLGTAPLFRCVVAGGFGALAFCVLLRGLFASSLRDLLAVAPEGFAAPARRVLFMPHARRAATA